MSAQPITSGIRLLQGGPEVMTATIRRIEQHAGRISGELYQAAYEPYTRALETHVKQGHDLDLLVNRHIATTPGGIDPELLPRLEGSGARIAHYDGAAVEDPAWMHTKSLYFHGGATAPDEAWVGNLAASKESLVRNEITTVVTGDRARAVGRLTHSAMSGNPESMRAASRDAERYGILINDSQSGIYSITSAIEKIIRDAQPGTELRVVTKGVDDIEMSTLVAEAAGRGVNVRVSVRDLAAADAAILERAGVAIDVLTQATPSMRVNYVANAHSAYLGTAFLWPKMVDPAAGTSRDLGMLFGGDAARDVRRAVDEVMAQVKGAESLHGAREHKLLKGTLTRKPRLATAEKAGLLIPPGSAVHMSSSDGAALVNRVTAHVDTGLAQLRAAAQAPSASAEALHGAAAQQLAAAQREMAQLRRGVEGSAAVDDAQRLEVSTALAADIAYLRRASRNPATVGRDQLVRSITDAERAVGMLDSAAQADARTGAQLLTRRVPAAVEDRAAVTTASQARAWLDQPAPTDRARRIIATGDTASSEPDTMIGLNKKGQNFHGALPVRTFVDPHNPGVAVQAVHKKTVDGAQELFAAETARALGIGHLIPSYGRRADGSFALEYVRGKSWWGSRVRNPGDLDAALASWYKREFPNLPAQEAAVAAQTDRQLMQFLDHLIANPDRHTMNGIVETDTGRVYLIDHGFAGRGETSDPLRTYLKKSYQGRDGVTELSEPAIEQIRTRLTDDVLDRLHSELRVGDEAIPADWAARLHHDHSPEFLAHMKARRDDVLTNARFSYIPQRLNDHPLSHEIAPGINGVD